MGSEKKLANAVGGKTARACDNCIRKRARWYCAADDAFLCQGCDASVHSANPLAQRHERVRLKTASSAAIRQHRRSQEPSSSPAIEAPAQPSWHRGFTRKARTPRKSKPAAGEERTTRNPLHFVPEVCSDDTSHEENDEEQLLYRVPIFDPFAAELCNSSGNSNEAGNNPNNNSNESEKPMLYDCSSKDFMNSNQFPGGSLPSEMDLAEFAADVESLLGKGLEDESSFDMESLGLIDMDCSFGRGGEVKVEEDEEMNMDDEDDHHQGHDGQFDIVTNEPFQFNFDECSLGVYEEESKVEGQNLKSQSGCEEFGENYNGDVMKMKKRKIGLSLDYESVVTAWGDKKSPWTNGERPEIVDIYDQCWPYCMGDCGRTHKNQHGEVGLTGHYCLQMVDDGGREARVSRYREKRRTRLFSKKIRYEVRKLNAEKRPRMKGRFVKRSNFAAEV